VKFIVEKSIFEKLPNACFGIVVARGINNALKYPEIEGLLDEAIRKSASQFGGKKIKEEPEIVPYREAFLALGINPNKFMCSIEALFTRIAKGKGMPQINSIVDLGNAVSLKYALPMGAHDIGDASDDICVRYSKPDDVFLPFGAEEEESLEEGEVVYAVGNQVRTRRWTWRQSEHGKITAETNHVFFPIDGFSDVNRDKVMAAQKELKELLQKFFGCEVISGFVDAEHTEMQLDFL